jgi:Ca-activated chloride channel family protein
MSALQIVVLVVVGVIVVAYLFGLTPEPARGRRPNAILRRRSKWRRWLPIVPLLLAVACLVLAFTGFRFSFQESSPAIVLVMDVSNSMNATDVAPNRLAAAETAAFAFLDQVPADFHVGLATFAGDANLIVPPTEDREAVIDALGSLTTSGGTVIGDGLTVALDAIEGDREAGDVPAAVLLLSDGRDTGSVVAPLDAAERARSMAVPVFTVVVGQVEATNGGGANIEALQSIAAISHGDTFPVETASELTSVYENLGSELSVELEASRFSTPLVIAAIVLALVAGFMLVLTPR